MLIEALHSLCSCLQEKVLMDIKIFLKTLLSNVAQKIMKHFMLKMFAKVETI